MTSTIECSPQVDAPIDDTIDGQRIRCSFTLICKSQVPNFGPPVPLGPVFQLDSRFRDYILTKLISGESAAYVAPVFAQKLRRTREAQLNSFIETYAPKQELKRRWTDFMPCIRAPNESP